jgi:dTDP-4-dehydrorhamnose 3,5-epimerase
MPFTFEKMKNNSILVIPKSFIDTRGWFLETYKLSDFEANGISGKFVQDNHSYSTYNVLRGIHYQKNPKPQGKLVRCIKGSILDIAVDLRRNSETFKQWVSVELSEQNQQMLWVPEGFGHGFITLTSQAEISYKCTAEYDSSLDSGIIWNDPDLNIDWENSNPPNLSEKDMILPTLHNAVLF